MSSTHYTNYTHRVDALSWHNAFQTAGRHVLVDRNKIRELLKNAAPTASTIKNPQIRADFEQIRTELESMRSQLQHATIVHAEPMAPVNPQQQHSSSLVKPQRQDTMVKPDIATPALSPSPVATTAKRPIVISSSSSSSSEDETAKPGPAQIVNPTAVKPSAAKTPTPKAKPGEVKKRKRGD